jgi:hypothetical protein
MNESHAPLSQKSSLVHSVGKHLISFAAFLGSMLLLAWVAMEAFGQPFLAVMALQKTSALMLMGCGVFHLYFLMVSTLNTEDVPMGKGFSSIWLPMKIALFAFWFIPTIPGPASENISPIAYLILSVFV